LGLAPSPKPLPWREQLALSSEAQQELWAECAAIMEVDGGLLADDAEQHAFALMRREEAAAGPTGGASPAWNKEDSGGYDHHATDRRADPR
jgi:hypothetical protein